jgi:hypothetical protein
MTTETKNIFEQATRSKLRFDTRIGQLSAENLWELPLSSDRNKLSLDEIAIELNRALKGTEESFVSSPKKDAVLQLKFDIVKHIIDTRVQEKEAKTAEVQRNSQIQKIDQLIEAKQGEKLANLSVEELQELKSKL